jgi:sulfoxide reductase catalytic subunit YedY
MLIKIPRGWEKPERAVTPEHVFRDRRRLIKGLAAGPLLLGAPAFLAGDAVAQAKSPADPSAELYPFKKNDKYKPPRALTPEKDAATYNNYYEFGSSKRIYDEARALPLRPWEVSFAGMVEQPMKLGIDDLMAKMKPHLEERIYSHRCVEAWSMVVPWSGFEMKHLLALAKPTASAKYVVMKTFLNPKVAPGQRQSWFPWPYLEGLTMDEAANELTFLVTGVYGKPAPHSMGAPLRIALPWKYGFKAIKGLVSFEFTDKRPVSFWEKLQGSEYGFWANVNPDVPHPRWSQATEQVLGTSERAKTVIWNGYGEYVAHLYASMKGEALFM